MYGMCPCRVCRHVGYHTIYYGQYPNKGIYIEGIIICGINSGQLHEEDNARWNWEKEKGNGRNHPLSLS